MRHYYYYLNVLNINTSNIKHRMNLRQNIYFFSQREKYFYSYQFCSKMVRREVFFVLRSLRSTLSPCKTKIKVEIREKKEKLLFF